MLWFPIFKLLAEGQTMMDHMTSISLDDQITSAIQTSPYLAGRKLRFETADGRVVLHGVVSSYFQKQMAQEALRSIKGLGEIDNQLEVAW